VCVASAAPAIPDEVGGMFAIREAITVEALGLTVYWNVWGSTGNRAINASAEIMFGASAGVTSGTMALVI
jgi:hypothetical protein